MTAGPNAIWDHANTIYDAMKKDSRRVRIEGVHAHLWEGFATHLFSEKRVPIPYYGKVLNALKEMGCIRLIKRGARTQPSQWALYKKPTRKDFDVVAKKVTTKRRSDIEAVEQRQRDVEKRIGTVDIPKVIAAMDKEIKSLKGRVSKLEKAKKAS